MSVFSDQADFMTATAQHINDRYTLLKLYRNLIEEEFEEFCEAFDLGVELDESLGYDFQLSPEHIKEAIDVIVVAAGFLNSAIGAYKAETAWRLVHASNMAKTIGGVEVREDGKILKNEEYKQRAKEKLMADLKDLISE